MRRFTRHDRGLASWNAREWCKWFRGLDPQEREQVLDGLSEMRARGVVLTAYESKALRDSDKLFPLTKPGETILLLSKRPSRPRS